MDGITVKGTGVISVSQERLNKLLADGVCKIICASVLSHRESSTMGKKGRRSKWRTKSANDC